MTDASPPGGPPRRQSLRVFDAWAIKNAVSARAAYVSAERAFKAMARGKVTVPPPMGVDFEDVHGEVHVKGAYIHGSPIFAFKVATGFYSNVQFGVPTGSGLVLVFDAHTGFPRCVLADNGYLTDLRTAAAGALAAAHLTPQRPLRVAMVGSGVQARMQLHLLTGVRTVAEASVWSPTRQSREGFAKRMNEKLKLPVRAVGSVAEAVSGADLVITVTPARKPLVEAGQLATGATVIAVGSDGPEKQELAPEILAAAHKVVTDKTAQCVTLGELHHAVRGGHMEMDAVYGELGQIVAGTLPGRENDTETIVCDLTGVGAQDAAIAEAAYRALARDELEDETSES